MVRKFSRGRIELEALRPEIEARFSNGQSLRRIYADLMAEGRLSVQERQFYNIASVIRDEWADREMRPATSPEKSPETNDDQLSVIEEQDSDAPASVVPFKRVSGASGFKLNPDFNLEE